MTQMNQPGGDAPQPAGDGDAQVQELIEAADRGVTVASESTAVGMALLAGRGTRRHVVERPADLQRKPIQAKSARDIAFDLMLGGLRGAGHAGRLLYPDPLPAKAQRDRAAKLVDHANRRLVTDAGKRRARPDQLLDFIAVAVDGASDLVQGRDGGSVSALAGGPRGVFADDLCPDSDEFLVLTMHPRLRDLGITEVPDQQLKLTAVADRVLRLVLKSIRADKNTWQPTIGTVCGTKVPNDHSSALPAFIADYAPVRNFCGSSISAALQTFFGHTSVDAFLSVVRKPHAFIIATAAAARGGHFYAMPLVQDQRATSENLMVYPEILRAGDFIRGDAFVSVTGVTESMLLEGVRFQPQGVLSTHTLRLRTRNNSSRFVSHQHSPAEEAFRRGLERDVHPVTFFGLRDYLREKKWVTSPHEDDDGASCLTN